MEEAQTAPLVSALIISRNTASDLRLCLGALEKSEQREKIEIVVVDSGSFDESPTLDNEFPAANFLRLPKNFGQTKALNIGCRTAKGEFVLLLRPQDRVEPSAISLLAVPLSADESIGATCPEATECCAVPSATDLRAFWQSGTLPISTGGCDCVLTDPILVRRSFLSGMNYFDDRYGDAGPRLELGYHLRSAGKSTLIVPGAIIDSPSVPLSQDPIAVADRLNAAAVYAGKHLGGGMGLRVGAALKALSSLQVGLAVKLIAGEKVDGTQSGA